MSVLNPEVEQFITRFVRSIGHLEAILFLYQRRGMEFAIHTIASELRTNAEYAKKQLEELAELGLVKRCSAPDCFVYESTPDLNEILETINNNYSRHRMAIINLLYSQPLDRIREFSDAFKIKKD